MFMAWDYDLDIRIGGTEERNKLRRGSQLGKNKGWEILIPNLCHSIIIVQLLWDRKNEFANQIFRNHCHSEGPEQW